jgi:hypothetical protein
MKTAIQELVARCEREEYVTLDDIDRYATSMNLSREQFYDAALLYAGEAFYRGEIPFDTGDAVANTLWGLSNFTLEGRARAVFLAFDEGEYYHKHDPEGSDPVQIYTRPQLEAVLQRGTSA